MVEKCGSAFEPHLTSELLQLVFTCLSHANRLVETGFIKSFCLLEETGFYQVIVSSTVEGRGRLSLHGICRSMV